MALKKSTVVEIFSRFQEKQATPRIELDYTNPFELLVAVVLSAQATDKGVNRVTPALFEIANTPQKMVELGEEKLKKHIKSIGLFNTKSANIIRMAQGLLDNFEGQVPADLKSLTSLPGVGRKSANVILNSIFGQKTIAVDTHIFRVSKRIGLCDEKTPEKTEHALMKVVPDEFLLYAHHWLVLHGRYVCKARKPDCERCIISDLCNYYKKRA